VKVAASWRDFNTISLAPRYDARDRGWIREVNDVMDLMGPSRWWCGVVSVGVEKVCEKELLQKNLMPED
jgi:hypothetical protein